MNLTAPDTVLVFAEGGGSSIPVRPWVVATTVIAGGVIGTVAAGVLEYDAMVRLGAVPMVFVGII